jgi:hypothetical protein
MDRVIEAGVGQPEGVFGFIDMLRISPSTISSASRIGVKRVFSGFGPAPEIPGTVLNMVLPRMLQNAGFFIGNGGMSDRNSI